MQIGQIVQIRPNTEEGNYAWSTRMALLGDFFLQVLRISGNIVTVYSPDQRSTFEIEAANLVAPVFVEACEAVRLHSWVMQPKVAATLIVEAGFAIPGCPTVPVATLLTPHELSCTHHFDFYGDPDYDWNGVTERFYEKPKVTICVVLVIATVLWWYFTRNF